jgi:hypothetical protein
LCGGIISIQMNSRQCGDAKKRFQIADVSQFGHSGLANE